MFLGILSGVDRMSALSFSSRIGTTFTSVCVSVIIFLMIRESFRSDLFSSSVKRAPLRDGSSKICLSDAEAFLFHTLELLDARERAFLFSADELSTL